MLDEELASHYPCLYNMAEADTWASIRSFGLLSTSALLDLFGFHGMQRELIESRLRSENVTIRHHRYGEIRIRDQKPMSETKLAGCLESMTTREWYQLLNGRVFFWPTRERLLSLLRAKEYRDRRHTVFTIDTRLLLNWYGVDVTLSPINSGSTIYKARPRGLNTFLPIEDYPFEERRRVRGIGNAVAEVAVNYAVPNIEGLTISVSDWDGDRESRKIH